MPLRCKSSIDGWKGSFWIYLWCRFVWYHFFAQSIEINEQYASALNYNLNYSVKELQRIMDYYEIKGTKLNKGNMIELLYKNISFLIMSSQAYKSLSELQIQKIEKFSKIIQSNVETIENCGGGSVRCMIAEVFN